jgi:hypothetical protein
VTVAAGSAGGIALVSAVGYQMYARLGSKAAASGSSASGGAGSSGGYEPFTDAEADIEAGNAFDFDDQYAPLLAEG